MKKDRGILSMIMLILGVTIAIVVTIGCVYVGICGIVGIITSGEIVATSIVKYGLLILFSESIGGICSLPFILVSRYLL